MSDILIYQTEDGRTRVNLLVQEHTVWLNQSQLAELFDTSVQNIGLHIKNILEDNELDGNSVIKDFFITAADGKQYQVKHYALEMILAVGFRVRSKRGVQFRRWANEVLTGYLEKGFALDDKRLKNPNGRVDYFDELLERIRDIRASEMRFYQKVRELFKLSADYDPTDKATQMFFAQAQNKLIYAVTQQTAAELVCHRADGNAPNMGLIMERRTRAQSRHRHCQKLPDRRRNRHAQPPDRHLSGKRGTARQKPARPDAFVLAKPHRQHHRR